MGQGLANRAQPHVVYWNNIPAPYMVERFNAIAAKSDLRFEAWFNDRTKPDRSWEVNEKSWRFAYRFLPTSRIGNQILHWPIPVLVHRPDLIVSLYAEPSFLFGWMLAKLQGTRTAFWCQVTKDTWVKRRAWKNAIKKFVFPRVDATFGSGQESRIFAMQFGTPPEKAFALRHSIDVFHYSNGAARVRCDRDRLRAEYQLEGTTFIYVGRLWSGKGLPVLLEAFGIVQRASAQPVSLLIVGDGPDHARLVDFCVRKRLRNVRFPGFRQKAELPLFYALADVFVFPTLGDPYGLVIDEAMACSLPVISTSAAGEIEERITDGINGYIVPPNDSVSMAGRMLLLVENAALRKRMGEVSAEFVSGNTPEKWADDFEKLVRKILSAPPAGPKT